MKSSVKAPMEIRVRPNKRSLSIAFNADAIYSFTSEFLRVESPSAEVRGHGNDEKRIVLGKEDVTIANIEPQGNYAVKITFSDGHNTGIYSWDYFAENGENMDAIWQTYLANVHQQIKE